MIKNTLFSMIRVSNKSKILSFSHINNIHNININLFSSVNKQQYNKKYLIRLIFQHSSDAYYQTYPFRQQFRKQIKLLEDSNKCYIFGGDLFPMYGALFVVNTDQKTIVEQFFNKNNVYAKNKLIKNVQIQQVDQISQQKMKKLSYFYQYK